MMNQDITLNIFLQVTHFKVAVEPGIKHNSTFIHSPFSMTSMMRSQRIAKGTFVQSLGEE